MTLFALYETDNKTWRRDQKKLYPLQDNYKYFCTIMYKLSTIALIHKFVYVDLKPA